ncbi:MAG: lactate racemase domain-containing protein [Actinomycetota bacterium]|jgi:nickel-dependent lactate racemase|nr:lactate racemase domain-containing protein [Actinomycetota bacterium]
MTDRPIGTAVAAPPAVVGGPDRVVADEEVEAFIADQLAAVDLDGRRVCVLVPDGTRTCPLPLMLAAIGRALHGRVARLSVLIALGTHAAMTDAHLAAHLGPALSGAGERSSDTDVIQHAWWEPSTFIEVGTIGADRVAELSEGRLRRDIPIRINRAVVEADLTLIVGPVFPHEVVGFSGGNKYLFPGVSGRELIDVSHWLGALITSSRIIGTLGETPVRALIDEAVSMVPGDRLALCVVTASAQRLHAATLGEPRSAWRAAAEISARTHIRYLDAPVRRVLSVLPEKYDDMWTGAKGFYKVEPVVADGGQVVIYAPHISEIATTHPAIAEIGYHCRDYFVEQWDRFERYAWGDLAHSTHLRGAGTYDPATGEHPRVTVTLATGIPEDVVRAVNLDYLDPAAVDPKQWASDPDTLVVPDAGEDLYRLT